MNLGVILQARMGSSRLPGKILRPIGTKPLLEYIIMRLRNLRHSTKLLVATTNTSADDVTEDLCRSNSIDIFRGSEEDVLSRYYECASQYSFSNIVRLTGDNPFTDVEELDRLIERHLEGDVDYSHSFSCLPVGCGAEIFTYEALERSHDCGAKQNHREHVNEYIQENPSLFRIAELSVADVKNRPDVRLTVDTDEDYRRACFIVNKSSRSYITTEDAIALASQFNGE